MKRFGIGILVLSFCASFVAGSDVATLADTKENRIAQAERYASVSPMGDMMADIVENLAGTMPDREAEELKQLFTEHIDLDFLERTVQELMVKHFTAEELSALADFYGSPVGKSAMAKFGAYMADAMPIIQREIAKAIQRGAGED